MAVFYILFAMGFRLLEGGKPYADKPAIATALFLVLYIVLYWLIGASGHDSEFVPTLPLIRDSLLHFFSLGSFHTFVILFPRLYLVPTVLLILTLVGYVRGRQWWKFWFLLLYAVGFLVAASIIYQTGDSPISRERYFIPLFFIVGLPFLVDELPRFTQRQHWIWYIVLNLYKLLI